jgi:hypothetical protein
MIEPVARPYSVLDPRDTFRPGLFGALPDKVSSSGADARAPLDTAPAQARRRRLLRRHQKVESVALSDHLSLRHQGSEQKPNFILLVRLKTSVDTPAFLIRSFPDGSKGKSKTKPPILDFVSRSLRGLPG